MPSEKELRLHCYFTGHRPEKLHRTEREIKEQLTLAVQQATDDGYLTFMIIMVWQSHLSGKVRASVPVAQSRFDFA